MLFRASEAIGGYPCGATKRVRGVPKSAGGRYAVLCLWGRMWSSLWGRETCEGCAEMGGRTLSMRCGQFSIGVAH